MQLQIGTTLRRTARLIRNDRDFLRAARRMPKPVPWDWAEPRLIPLLAGPRNDTPGEELVRAPSRLGPVLMFGIDLGGHFPLVDRSVAERWETSPGQLLETSLANLRRRAAAVGQGSVATWVRSGRIVRVLRRPVGFASSLLLLSEELERLFGRADQVFGAPGRHTLVSFPADMPSGSIAEIHTDIEVDELMPLFLLPFVWVDRELLWSDTTFDEDDGDDEGRVAARHE